MDEIVKRIIDIEHDAQQIVNEAREEQRSSERTIAEEIEAFRAATAERNASAIDAYVKRMRAEADEGAGRIEAETEEKAGRMRALAESKQDEWVERLYNMIINGNAT